MKFQRLWIAIASVIFAAALATAAHAQYQPIPAYKGIGAGQAQLNAINSRFGGMTPISPALVSTACNQMPPEVNGAMLYCVNCNQNATCTCGGPGAIAIGQANGWSCGATTAGTLSGDVNGPAGSNTVSTVLNGETPVTTAYSLVGDLVGTPPATSVSALHLSQVTVSFASSPYTFASSNLNTTINCNAAGGNVVINPTFASGSGKVVTIKKTDSSSNTCTFNAGGSGYTVDGASTYVLSTQYQWVSLYDGGSNVWSIWSASVAATGSLAGDASGPIGSNVVNTVLNGETPVTTTTPLAGDVIGELPDVSVWQLHLDTETATGSGGGGTKVINIVTNGAVSIVNCDTTASNIIVQAFKGSGSGKTLTVKKIDSSANTCTLEAISSTIDGNSTIVLSSQWQTVTVYDSGVGLWSVATANSSSGTLTGDASGPAGSNVVNTVLSGKTPAYLTEVNPQFNVLAQPYVVSYKFGGPGSSTDVVTKPPTTLQGDMLLYYIAVQSSTLTVTPPDGTWHLIKSGTTNSSYTDASYYKVAGSSEPTSYTFTISSGNFGTSGMIDIRQENQSSPVDANNYFYSTGNTTSATVPAAAATHSPDLTLILLGSSSNPPYTVSSPAGATSIYLNTTNSIIDGAWSYTGTPVSASLTNNGTSALWMLQQISIAPAPYGPAAVLVNGQPGATLASPSFTGTTAVTGSLVGSGSSAALSNMNVNGQINVTDPAYGAVGDCSTQDGPAFQAAINAACAVGAIVNVNIPTPPAGACYSVDGSLFVPCSGVKITGPGVGAGNRLIQEKLANGAPLFVLQQTSMAGPTLGTALVSGSANAAVFTGSTNPYYINLNDAPPAIMGLNGRNTGTIDAYVNLTSTADGAIAWSTGRKATYLSPTNAYWLRIVSGKFSGEMTVGGTPYTLTDNTTTLATATLYDVQLSYDGSDIRMFTNGVLVATQAATGTITQPYWEVSTVGASVADWPDGAIVTTPINGSIDGVQVSINARHTAAFTPCNCAPTNDSNNLVLWNPGAKNVYMETQLSFQSAGAHTVMSYTRRGSTAGVNGIEIDGVSYQGGVGSMGVIGQDGQGWHIRHDTFANVADGVYLFNNDFESTYDDDYILGSYVDFFVGGQSGLQFLTGGIQLVGGLVGLRVQDSGVAGEGVVVQEQNGMVWGYSIQGDTGTDYFACHGCGMDAEISNAMWLGGLQLDNLEVAAWTGGAISAIGSSPVVEVDGGSNQGSAVFSGVNFTPTGSSPEVFHVANSNSPGLVTVIGPREAAASSWMDSPADVVLTPCRGSATLSSGAGTFSSQCLLSQNCTAKDTTTLTNTCTIQAASPGRIVTDGVENGTTTITSATASFVSGDVGRGVLGANIPANDYIASVTNGTTVVLHTAATGSATGVTLGFDAVAGVTGTGTDVCSIGCP